MLLDGAPFAAGGAVSQPGPHTLSADRHPGRPQQDRHRHLPARSSPPDRPWPSPRRPTLPRFPASKVDVAGTVTGEGVTVAVDGRAATVTGNLFHLTGYPLAENEAVTITARGHRSPRPAGRGRVLVLHRAAGPRVLILDPADGTVTSRDRIDVAGAVVDPPGSLQSPSVTISGGAGGPVVAPLQADGSFRARDVPLGAGASLLEARAVDRFGQPGSSSVTVIRDGSPPAIAIAANGQALAEGAVFGAVVTVVVSFSDDSGTLTEQSVRLNGQLQPSAAGNPAGNTVTLQLNDDGGYLLSVVARDDAGNTARAERSFVIDRGGCGLSEIFPAAGAAVEETSVTLAGRSGGATALKVRVPGGAGTQEFAAALADGTFMLAGVPLPAGGRQRARAGLHRCRRPGRDHRPPAAAGGGRPGPHHRDPLAGRWRGARQRAGGGLRHPLRRRRYGQRSGRDRSAAAIPRPSRWPSWRSPKAPT